ncbi:glycosyltransferase family 4 protein [Aquiflexum gelatinilyticum]|uniref:glycosyltransferase family 4 protein n=1 Tax=Aquiflexum gelatinilyticum TaxID=2961943 RepID=UPI00216AAC24|nr:glycosyltransferase family 4 protein [Aquiflexum gelatinilyticum]MCS4435668.1 glycosyltransferase family 4 protein [Aquiflexum gelatinilyticum]
MVKPQFPTDKNVLMLHGSSDLYGASKIFLESVQALKKVGYEVIVVLSEDGPLVEELKALKAEVHIHKLGILRRKYFSPSGLVNRFKTILKAKSFLETLMSENRITHIYSNTSAVLVGSFLARKKGVKHIWHLHEILLSPGWFVWLMGIIINRYADIVVVVSQAVWDNWKDKVDESKLALLHNGIDYRPYLETKTDIRNEIPNSEGKVLIGMIGRINHWKGQGYFLDIAQSLVQTHENVHFVIVGDAYPGTEHLVTEMEEKVKNSGLQTHVSYLGFRRDIPEILQAFDIFVLPSILPDPFPTVILEAMASGKPVVATAQGGAKEMIVKGETGFLIPWDNAGSASEAISDLVNKKEMREKMGEKGRSRVLEKFSPEAFKKNFQRLFENG